jgi:sulfur relay (sulfurtransferase) DsrF/TusC family protein
MHIASNETSSLDINIEIIGDGTYKMTITINEDIIGDTSITYILDRYDLKYLYEIIQPHLNQGA